MERFVRLIVAGGLSLLAGLWAQTLTTTGSRIWYGGLVLVLVGLAGLAAGIQLAIDVR